MNYAQPLLVTPGKFWPAPDITAAAFVAPNATVIGHISLAEGASVWYGTVIRGDVEKIQIGRCSNVQDGAVLHGDVGFSTVLEDYVTVGHRAVIHGAYVESGSLIGIGAVLLNGVRIGTGSIVGAGAVVTKSVPARSLVMGIPGKVVRSLSEQESAELIEHAQKYRQLAEVHAGTRKQLGFV
ncbi:MAG: gamma carbonic anhydrase family protein [Leptolyngbyaceae cyanobacterium SM1_1_3]|nr:gamma carbonic anhydrase family protein [Leptolyngbyaceae cyanobacterium SM1_1_3]NJN01273.1 gamma carbonic anhydrase family protein [Leptolyngbyaceae cyanobacterium RM1_1_2]NJO10879.1 gamma carbonic anhydrase family protein [Leptolyngbyaceae cyanobacterium SL_1_1]